MSTSTKEQIKKSIFEILSKIAPEIEASTIDVTEDIREEFEIDSMDFLRVVVDLDEKYGIEIPESDYGDIMTVEKMIAYLHARHQ